MLKIRFRYKDEMSRWEWREQSCVMRSVSECRRIYGLDSGDCQYEILEVTDLDTGKTEGHT